MLVSLIKKDNIKNLYLPNTTLGNYWLSDIDKEDNERNLVNIEAKDNNWILKSNDNFYITAGNQECDNVKLKNYNFYILKSHTSDEIMLIYCCPIYDTTNKMYNITTLKEITIGKSGNCAIVYDNPNLLDIHVVLTYDKNNYMLKSLNEKNYAYVNGIAYRNKVLEVGDIIFIYGLKIIYGGSFIVINNPNNLVRLNASIFQFKDIKPLENISINEDDYLELYKEDDYYIKSPRFRTKIERKSLTIDSPPEKQEEDDTPIFYTIGPMVTMGMISLVTTVTNVSSIITGEKTFKSGLPSLIIAVAMLCTMLVWPILMKKYENKKRVENEKKRQEKYGKYLANQKKEIANILNVQKQILIENNITLEQCQDIILNKKRNLWERDINEDDFLTVRLGIGNISPEIDINYPEEHFSMMEDNLKQMIQSIVEDAKAIAGVPISISLVEKNIVALVGEEEYRRQSLESIILQLVTFHDYKNLNIAFFTDEISKESYEYLNILPHIWNEEKSLRFFADNLDSANQISNYLEKKLEERKINEEKKDYKLFYPYYILIIENLNKYRNLNIVKKLLELKENYGFSIIILNDKLSNLPNGCSSFISISSENGIGSGFFENELISTKQKMFDADLNASRVNMYACCQKLANIPLKIDIRNEELPNMLSFLEMYNVGNIEQLNIINRWKNNDPSLSLQVPVGIGKEHQLFKLDLHEKYHGPHGLIAGMTGSGKSEFIITFILSLAINFHPSEVQFVLIDYKGGGLAGAFTKKDSGIRLPHLIGTITNLDTMEMKRSLDSIQSELKRRQKLFNLAREKLNESTMDIYKYQKMYRAGLVSEPMSHLFIISDEFAELKQQQPEFMTQLISTARIGRSLGVHLILATQKPSGIVDDQIWSNSKFRICLKVQDKSDSIDMIKCPDAAALTDVGRFYLQVGYNEYFALGQSAWTGATYFPKDMLKKKVDTSIKYINDIGISFKDVEDLEKKVSEVGQGEELFNIVNYLSQLANHEKISINQLWLDKIPEVIYVSNLINKYQYKKELTKINPVIGEYDDPANQRQGLVTLDLSDDGNTIIYGRAGSGKSNLLMTIIYSSIINYSVNEVNFYILDFGSEILRVFKDAPQVGDVILSSEDEKIANMFKMLEKEVIKRREILLEFNGDFKTYNQKNSNKLPYIIIVINEYEVFQELYEDYSDKVISFTRDCIKYGIIFIISVNSANSVRQKLKQNFKENILLQLNDQGDYGEIFGTTNGLYPSEIFGRGLIKKDKVYEFQTAYANDLDNLVPLIKEICQNLSSKMNKASRIPILPDKVSNEYLNINNYQLDNIPLGIGKNSLEIINYDFIKNNGTMITGLDSNCYESFVNELVEGLLKLTNTQVVVIDTDDIIKKVNNLVYYNNNYEEVVSKIIEIIDYYLISNQKGNKVDKQFVYLFVGFPKLLKNINDTLQKQLIKKLKFSKEIKQMTSIFIDPLSTFKTNEFETWYRDLVLNNQCIWIGNGIFEQYTVKVSKLPKEAREEITNEFGYVVDKGRAVLVKFIENGDIYEK